MGYWTRARALVLIALVPAVGCRGPGGGGYPVAELPRELDKVSLPDYVIEPPDILRINAVRLLPQQPYRVQPLDALDVRSTETFPNQPVAGVYPVSPDGTVDLGFNYGTVVVLDKTLGEAKAAIADQLRKRIKDPEVTVALAQAGALQQIQGDHLVGPDGKVTLGVYGSVRVVGMTREQAKAAIEAHLSGYLFRPQLALDVIGYNSKVYYLITDGGGAGEQVFRLPITGNETVLDAVSQINGLPSVASKKHIWLARPVPCEAGQFQTFPVDWKSIAECGATGTNYQLLPGDRVYVKAQPLVTADNAMARFLAPVERVLGVTLLGSTIGRDIAQIRALNRNNTGVIVTGP
jgi:polysaccharide export outer membrane protein